MDMMAIVSCFVFVAGAWLVAKVVVFVCTIFVLTVTSKRSVNGGDTRAGAAVSG